VLNLLADLKREFGLTYLFISHDLNVVRYISDRVIVMYLGEVVELGPVDEVWEAPAHPYTRALLEAEPRPDPAPLCPDAPMVIETKDLKVWFPIKRGVMRRVVGHIKAVDGVSIAVRQGETLGIVGESGSGKTTLGLAILRLVSSEGPIVFLGSKISGLTFRKMRPFRRHMQIVFQDPYGSLSPRMSVSDIVEEGLGVHDPKSSKQQREQRVVAALREVGLDPDTRFRYPHEFSGGQRQRIALARAVVLEPSFIVLDEPTSALDVSLAAVVLNLIARLRAEGKILEIGPGDLSLTPAEAASLLDAAGLALGDEDVAELHRRTEGWPAGLYLAALYLKEGGSLAGAVVSFGGGDRFISDYVESEFLARISRQKRAFLTQTAVLERMCGPLCEAVLDSPGAHATLAELARSNLLLVPLDRRGEWYRYHHLFRDMLLAQLERQEPGLLPALRRRAAGWCEQNGLPEEALEYFIAAGDVGENHRRQSAGVMQPFAPAINAAFICQIAQHALERRTICILGAEGARDFADADLAASFADEGDKFLA